MKLRRLSSEQNNPSFFHQLLTSFTWNSKRVPKILTFDPGARSRSNLGQMMQKKMWYHINSPVLGLRRGLGRYEKCHCFCIKNTAFFKNITSLFSTSLLQKWSISKIALKSSKMSLGQVQWTGWSLLKYHDVIFD